MSIIAPRFAMVKEGDFVKVKCLSDGVLSDLKDPVVGIYTSGNIHYHTGTDVQGDLHGMVTLYGSSSILVGTCWPDRVLLRSDIEMLEPLTREEFLIESVKEQRTIEEIRYFVATCSFEEYVEACLQAGVPVEWL